MTLIDKVVEYKHRLTKHCDDKTVVKDTLYKLNKMPVTFEILHKTGIGKVLSAIKKRGGSTGEYAAELTKKWKLIVDREADSYRPSPPTEVPKSHSVPSSSKHSRDESSNNNNSSSHNNNDIKHHKSSSSSHSKSASRSKKEVPEELFSKPDHREIVKKSSESRERTKHSSSRSLETRNGSTMDKVPPEQPKIVEKKADDEDDDNGKSRNKSDQKKQRKRKRGSEEMTADFGSFEDCLGSVEPMKSRKKKKNKSSSSPKMTVTTSTLNGSSKKPSGPRFPDLFEKKPSALPSNLDIPQLVTEYKPLPRFEPKAQPQKRTMTNDEAVMFTSSRKDRTAVYSGRKNCTLTSVPTVDDACSRVLIDDVDYIEETSGVPYDIMKPIMERCTWQQLYHLEDYNPYLIEDSDPLWEIHTRKDFRGKEPLKGEETWRELYLRCYDEREQKLKSITASISHSMKQKQAPVRVTKLAYVDSMAKPPRNVQRTQLKHGTHIGNKAEPSQARRIATKASSSSAIEPVRAPSAAAKKPKQAPLMAKTRAFLKMRRSTGYGFSSR